VFRALHSTWGGVDRHDAGGALPAALRALRLLLVALPAQQQGHTEGRARALYDAWLQLRRAASNALSAINPQRGDSLADAAAVVGAALQAQMQPAVVLAFSAAAATWSTAVCQRRMHCGSAACVFVPDGAATAIAHVDGSSSSCSVEAPSLVAVATRAEQRQLSDAVHGAWASLSGCGGDAVVVVRGGVVLGTARGPTELHKLLLSP
jgi:hypothetical protein